MDLWVEKYEPKTLNEIIGQEKLVNAFKAYIARGFVPNMTLGGEPGLGKTLIVKCYANDAGLMDEPGQYTYLNASDERGIDMVRSTLKMLAMEPLINGQVRLIVLDEGDSITADAQAAMRATIQTFSSNSRFIIIGNYTEKMIDAINSRCPLKTVMPLTKENIVMMVKRIQEKEKFEITQDAVDTLFIAGKGDMRLTIGKLQDAALISNFNIQKHHITTSNTDIETAKKILEIAITDFNQAKEILITEYNTKRDPRELIIKLYKAVDEVMFSNTNNELMQRSLKERIQEADFRLTQGTNVYIQLDAILNYVKLMYFIPLTCPRAK
jgi:replication factor C small subunit